MRFQCLNCEKLFIYPATLTEHKTNCVAELGTGKSLKNLPEDEEIPILPEDSVDEVWHTCPYCGSLDLEEYTPEPEQKPTEEIESVYIYDLTSGAQTELDKLLADGYKIVNRYSKQYHLEKPKTAEAQQ